MNFFCNTWDLKKMWWQLACYMLQQSSEPVDSEHVVRVMVVMAAVTVVGNIKIDGTFLPDTPKIYNLWKVRNVPSTGFKLEPEFPPPGMFGLANDVQTSSWWWRWWGCCSSDEDPDPDVRLILPPLSLFTSATTASFRLLSVNISSFMTSGQAYLIFLRMGSPGSWRDRTNMK